MSYSVFMWFSQEMELELFLMLLPFQTAPLTWLSFLTSVIAICITMQRLEMPLLVDTPVVPNSLGEIKGVRDEGCVRWNAEMVGTGI